MQEENVFYKELQAGTILMDGKYTIEKKIGEGGFGITYRAIQSGLSRVVCIKEYFPSGKCSRNTYAKTVHVPDADESLFEKYRQSFVREAKMLAALHHPGIVEVIDVFDENNTSYMVMEFINGRTLQSIVEKQGALSYPNAINYIAQITNAVAYIHERHILHRDIKPDNILITDDNKAILIDFGSAREFEQDKTQRHTSMLTLGYAPTEQYTANSRKGSYTDIYSIGATLYFSLTGQVPLEAAARLNERMQEPKELNPAIPDEANRTILKAMQLKAENRHQTVQEFMDDLCNVRPSVLVDETIGGKLSNKRLWLWISAAVLLTAIICIVLLSFYSARGMREVKTVDFTAWGMYPMVKVSGGTFIMGEEETEEEDCPPHKVTVSDFYMGVFEVSQGLWEKVMGNNPSAHQIAGRNDSLPVENVSFGEVAIFIKRLNKLTGKKFTLPTEAQWEYAARGGDKSHGYKFSGSQYPNNVWYNKGVPIKIKIPAFKNELGLFHMSGNVAEWCLDYYHEDFYNAEGRNINPLNTQKNELRVIRGGSFNDEEAKYVTVYYRDADKEARPYVGFRLVINIGF